MSTSENNINDSDKEFNLSDSIKKQSRLAEVARNLLIFLLLAGVIAASFWLSFLLGRRILAPVKKMPQEKIEMAIPEPPESIAGLQAIEEVEAVIEKPKPAPQKKSYPRTSGRYYKVQAGYFNVKSNAYNLAKKLRLSGFETYIKKIGRGWRVQVGAFRGKTRAQNLKSALRAKGFEAAIVYE